MGRGKAAAAALVTALALLVLLWGASSRVPLVGPPQGTPVPVPPPPPATVADTTAVTQAPRTPIEGAGTNIPWEQIIIGLILMAALILLLRWLLARDWEPEEVDLHEQPDEIALLLEATSAESRARALTEGDPRNAVVGCWVALEDAAERAGLERYAAETSAEFTTRVLGAWSVPVDTIEELAGLYREARFSRHPVTEGQRQAAVTALERIHASLSGRTVA